MSLKSELIRFAKELEETDNASFMLWTWLPSYKMARKAHGDYADEHRPPTAELMKETCEYLSLLKWTDKWDLSEEHRREPFRCICEECPVPTEQQMRNILENKDP